MSVTADLELQKMLLNERGQQHFCCLHRAWPLEWWIVNIKIRTAVSLLDTCWKAKRKARASKLEFRWEIDSHQLSTLSEYKNSKKKKRKNIENS